MNKQIQQWIRECQQELLEEKQQKKSISDTNNVGETDVA